MTAAAIVTHIREDKPIVTIENVFTNQAGAAVVTGEGKIMLLD